MAIVFSWQRLRVFASARLRCRRIPRGLLLIALHRVVSRIEASWYLAVATMMSRPTQAGVTAGARSALDRRAATFMAGLGALFAIEGLRGAPR